MADPAQTLPGDPPPAGGRARRAAIVGLRVVTGVVGVAAAAAIVAAVGLLPLPSRSIAVPAATVTPVPADELRVCPGALLHLGDDVGQNAGTPSSIRAASVEADARGSALQRSAIAHSDADTGGTSSAPTALRITPSAGSLLSGAQSQSVQTDDVTGFAAASCTEPSGSIWLVGGSTAVGRTTVLSLTNPTAVDATVTLTILGERGPVSAPGLSGIVVPAGTQRVLSLAGFAPGLSSPVVHVVARGGRVVATLQQSTVRGLDTGGVDQIGPAADPARRLQIPGLRVFDSAGLSHALGLADWSDAVPTVRVAVPGDKPAKVQISLLPESAGAAGTSFELDVPAGQSMEAALDSGVETDSGAITIADGQYAVLIDSDQPVVAGVRLTTATDQGGAADTAAPPTDFAWYPAAPALTGDTMMTVAHGVDPRVAVVNPGSTAATLTLQPVTLGASTITLKVAAHDTVSAAVVSGASYTLSGGDGLAVAVGYASAAALASYPIASARPVSGPIVIHP